MRRLVAVTLVVIATPLAAKDSLGIFEHWGAFRDPAVPRCYAIAEPLATRQSRDLEPFATVATWPRKKIRGQVHFRLSRAVAPNARITLKIGRKSFRLEGAEGDVWASGRAMDAAIVAAMRSADSMTLRATDRRGRRFYDSYPLDGAATAMDAATVACAKL